jgi:hypothetical protein
MPAAPVVPPRRRSLQAPACAPPLALTLQAFPAVAVLQLRVLFALPSRRFIAGLTGGAVE